MRNLLQGPICDMAPTLANVRCRGQNGPAMLSLLKSGFDPNAAEGGQSTGNRQEANLAKAELRKATPSRPHRLWEEQSRATKQLK